MPRPISYAVFCLKKKMPPSTRTSTYSTCTQCNFSSSSLTRTHPLCSCRSTYVLTSPILLSVHPTTQSLHSLSLHDALPISVDKQASHFVHIPGLSYSGVKSPTECQQSLFESHFASRQSLSDCPVAF